VFEKAVKPYRGSAALKAEFPGETPLVIMKKGEELPKETRELEGGGTLTVPVLGALKDAKLASWHRVGQFDFESMEADAVGLLLAPRGAGAPAIRVVTRASDGALLVADLDGMLDALKALVDQPAFKAFPGGDFLTEALIQGITAAKEDLGKALAAPDAEGNTLYDAFKEPPLEAKGTGKAKKRQGKKGA